MTSVGARYADTGRPRCPVCCGYTRRNARLCAWVCDDCSAVIPDVAFVASLLFALATPGGFGGLAKKFELPVKVSTKFEKEFERFFSDLLKGALL